MRHAESVANEPGVRDHDRSISESGASCARRVAQHLRELQWLPDLLLCSSSKRTQETVDVMAQEINNVSRLNAAHFEDPVYDASLYTVAALDGQTKATLCAKLLELAKDSANKIIMCVGHNRGWQEAASSYTRTQVQLGTSSAALMEIEAQTWEEALADDSIWDLVGIVTPQGGLEVYNGVSARSY